MGTWVSFFRDMLSLHLEDWQFVPSLLNFESSITGRCFRFLNERLVLMWRMWLVLLVGVH